MTDHDRLRARLSHRVRVIWRSRRIARIRRHAQQLLDGLGRARTVDWVEFHEPATTGHTIHQRLRVTPSQRAQIERGEWSPRRKLAVGDWG